MAKQIIILERPDVNRFTVAFWLAVPAERQPFYADPAARSAYLQASSLELSALQSGAVVERVKDIALPAAASISMVQAALVTEFTRLQAEVTALNKWNRYGTFYDGANWTAGGVA